MFWIILFLFRRVLIATGSIIVILVTPKYDGKDFLQLSVCQFCQDMLEATNQWLEDVSSNQAIQNDMKEMLVIHEGAFSIGGGLRIG
jgi:hypothetical protein